MMWIALACGIVGGAILAWYACRDGWFRRRPKQPAPPRRHLQHITTEVITAALLDEQRRVGVPLPNTNGVTTKVTNVKRRTTP